MCTNDINMIYPSLENVYAVYIYKQFTDRSRPVYMNIHTFLRIMSVLHQNKKHTAFFSNKMKQKWDSCFYHP